MTNAYPVRDRPRPKSKRRTGARSARTCATRGRTCRSLRRPVERALSRDPRSGSRRAGAFETALAEFLVSPRRSAAEPAKGVAERRGRRERGAGDFVATAWTERRGRISASVRAGGSGPLRAAALPASYRIDTAFYRRRGGNTRLRAGDHIAPGDALFVELQVSTQPTSTSSTKTIRASLAPVPVAGPGRGEPIAAETTASPARGTKKSTGRCRTWAGATLPHLCEP